MSGLKLYEVVHESPRKPKHARIDQKIKSQDYEDIHASSTNPKNSKSIDQFDAT